MSKVVKYLVFCVVFGALFLLGVCFWQKKQIARARFELNRSNRNVEALMTDVVTYRFRDSLSAARVQSLELKIKDFERLKSQDAKLIKELQTKNRDLASVNMTQAQTIINLSSVARDTVVIRDSVQVSAVSVRCGDSWYDFSGLLLGDDFTGMLKNRDSLILVETVKYKRFLGFLWKTQKIKDRRTDLVSKNPHTTIMGVEHIVIVR